jgi:hypothetical protein
MRLLRRRGSGCGRLCGATTTITRFPGTATGIPRWGDPVFAANVERSKPKGPDRLGGNGLSVRRWIPCVHIKHPYPGVRFDATYARFQPYTGNPPVQICADRYLHRDSGSGSPLSQRKPYGTQMQTRPCLHLGSSVSQSGTNLYLRFRPSPPPGPHPQQDQSGTHQCKRRWLWDRLYLLDAHYHHS